MTPIGQEAEVLRIMYEGHFSEEEINIIEHGLSTTNVLDEQKIKKLVRKIIKNKKNGSIDLDSIKELISLCKDNLSRDASKEEIKKTKQVLFYVRDND